MYSSDLLKYCHCPPPDARGGVYPVQGHYGSQAQAQAGTPLGGLPRLSFGALPFPTPPPLSTGHAAVNPMGLPAGLPAGLPTGRSSSPPSGLSTGPPTGVSVSGPSSGPGTSFTRASFSSLDTLTSVAAQSFKDLDSPLGSGFQPLSRSHASSVSSVSSNSSASSASSGKSGKDPRRKRSNLPKKSTGILMAWLGENLGHPYPNTKEKMDLIRKTGLTPQQLSNWFINARRRKLNMQGQGQGPASAGAGAGAGPAPAATTPDST